MTERKKIKRDPNITRRKITIDRPAFEINEVDRQARLVGFKSTPKFVLECIRAAKIDVDRYTSIALGTTNRNVNELCRRLNNHDIQSEDVAQRLSELTDELRRLPLRVRGKR